MKGWGRWFAVAGLTAVWSGGSSAQPPIPPVPLIRPALEILTYPDPASTVTCDGGAARVVTAPAPASALWTTRPPMVVPVIDRRAPGPTFPPPPPPAHAFLFNVDAQGRTTSIRRQPAPSSAYDTGDHAMQATMAAWRFAPGRPRRDCRYAAEPRRTPLSQASRPLALRLISEASRPGFGAEEVGRLARGPGSDCGVRGPSPRVQVYPAFELLPAAPGRRDWVALGYDLDSTGRPQRVEVLASSGSAPLDAAGRDALIRSQYQPGARRSCLYWYWRSPGELPAPPRPDLSTFVRPGDDCPNEENRTGRVKFVDGARHYPSAFRERNILGWAVVRFDVANWGAVGPAEVVASEPAAAFGQAAQNLVRTAKADPGPGWRGCLQHVVFKLADEGDPPLTLETELRVR